MFRVTGGRGATPGFRALRRVCKGAPKTACAHIVGTEALKGSLYRYLKA